MTDSHADTCNYCSKTFKCYGYLGGEPVCNKCYNTNKDFLWKSWAFPIIIRDGTTSVKKMQNMSNAELEILMTKIFHTKCHPPNPEQCDKRIVELYDDHDKYTIERPQKYYERLEKNRIKRILRCNK